ncbi:hypothetical protein ACFLYB_06990 [Chloroflexota bacterium]
MKNQIGMKKQIRLMGLLLSLVVLSTLFVAGTINSQPVSTPTTVIGPTQPWPTIQSPEPQNLISDEQIMERAHKVIRMFGLDREPEYTLTAEVENGVLTIGGKVHNFDEDNMLVAMKSIDGVERINWIYGV